MYLREALEDKYFCTECRDYKEYTLEDENATFTFKEHEIHYIRKSLKCITCGAYLYTPVLNDANLKTLYDKIDKIKANE